MDNLLERLIRASGVSGYEKEITQIMVSELKKSCGEVNVDKFGNVIARSGQPAGLAGSGAKKIMLAAHMDEIGLVIKHITKEGFLYFIKIGGIDDGILVGQRVLIKAKKGDVLGVIGHKPPHLQKEEDKKTPLKYDSMFIDIGCKSREQAEGLVNIGDAAVFEPNFGRLSEDLYYGKAIDNRLGCYALLKVMERLKDAPVEVYAVATVQEEVGLKGARTASFKIDPDFAIAIDTTCAGDTPQIKETESNIKLGAGVAITLIEAAGRGTIVSEKIKDTFIEKAQAGKIKYQLEIVEGGMTDGAMIYMNKEGIPTGVLAIPARYIHGPSGVFSMTDIDAAIALTCAVVKDF